MERPRPDIDNVRRAMREHDEREADEPDRDDDPGEREDDGGDDEQDDPS